MSETEEFEHDSDGLPQYEVEAILRSRQRYGRLQYLVKWKRMSSKYNTWENNEDLCCKDQIQKYLNGEEEEYYESSSTPEEPVAPEFTTVRKRAPKTQNINNLFSPIIGNNNNNNNNISNNMILNTPAANFPSSNNNSSSPLNLNSKIDDTLKSSEERANSASNNNFSNTNPLNKNSNAMELTLGQPSKKMGPKIYYKKMKEEEREKNNLTNSKIKENDAKSVNNKLQPKFTDAYKNGGKVYFILAMPDGSVRELTSTIAKCKYPLQLIDFLESKANFERH